MRVDRTTVTLVTGAGRGIGAAIAQRLRAEGATVVTADLAFADIDLDVTDRVAVRTAIAGVVETHGRLDLAVACAGIGVGGLASEVSDADWDRSTGVNLTGTLNTVRAAYEVMLPRATSRARPAPRSRRRPSPTRWSTASDGTAPSSRPSGRASCTSRRAARPPRPSECSPTSCGASSRVPVDAP